MSDWPFSTAQLTAGLRRYFADSSVQLRALSERPFTRLANSTMPSRLRGLRVDYETGGQALSLDCVLKEPRGTKRAGLAGGGIREVGVYRALAPQLPVQTPALVAADATGSWLITEAVPADRSPAQWAAEDYLLAVRTLASVHERFWDLSEDLSVYTWLARPLSNDFEIYVLAAVTAMEKMMVDNRHQLLTGSLEVLTGLGQLLSQVEAVAKKLRAAPPTLLHGDFHPGNLLFQDEDEVFVFDWQLAGVGPGVLDLITFVNACVWERPNLPVAPETLKACYRDEMAARVGIHWTDDEWTDLLDQARMWCFIQEMLGWAANATPQEFSERETLFRDIWLRPVLDAANRRLRPVLYL
jgi:hypothetical protein